MSRKSGVWSSVGDDRGETKETTLLRGRGEKIGKDFCIFNPSVLWTPPYILLRDTAGGGEG